MNNRSRRGYTLMELVIAVLVIGILASFAVPQYLRSIEGGKYDDAVGLTNQIGMTNRMFALDHQGFYATGQFTTTSCCPSGTTCASILGPFQNAAGQVVSDVTNPCVLVCCNYLGDQNWPGKPYNFYACSATTSGGGGNCTGNTAPVASAKRVSGANPGTNISPYNGWGTWMDNTGTINKVPASGASAPPNPTY
jgi:prepilin-type N-terminal cleavage/methylation domain-containing protein